MVEDDPVTGVLLRRHVESQGYRVEQASDGVTALEKHRKNPVRIVVSDWNMPEMDGTTLCREFRKLGGSYVYFVLCSARTEKADRSEAFEAGVDDFLTKPVDKSELAARLTVARRILASEDRLTSQQIELAESTRQLHRSNLELQYLSKKYSELFQGLPVACFVFDIHGVVREWNRQAELDFGIESDQAIGKNIRTILTGSPFDSEDGRFGEVLGVGKASGSFDWCFEARSGETRHFATSVMWATETGPSLARIICSNLDITDRKRAETKANEYAEELALQKAVLEKINVRLNHLAVTDELTGLANRRHFREVLANTIETCQGQNVSLMLMDIDHFKRVNDAFGHLTGDDILRQFANLLRRTATSQEILSRYGGEEFAILLQGTTTKQAYQVAERYRMSIEEFEWNPTPITVSIGVASMTGGSTSEEDLVGRADLALYSAKAGGRNRVCSLEPSMITPSFG